MTATRLKDGRVLAIGGTGEHLWRSEVEIYDPLKDQWSSAGHLSVGRRFHNSTLLPSGKVIVVGGDYDLGLLTDSVEIYDPATNSWASSGIIYGPSESLSLTALSDGRAFIFGGDGGRIIYRNYSLWSE